MSDPKAKARARSSARWARAAAIIPATPLDDARSADLDYITEHTGLTKSGVVRAAIKHFRDHLESTFAEGGG